MNEPNAEGIRPSLPPRGRAADAQENRFMAGKKYPGLSPGLEVPISLPGPAVPRKNAFRLLVPTLLFVLVIGGIAWVVQYLPNWRGEKTPGSSKGLAQEVIRFRETQASWDPDDTSYAKEFERDSQGHYDFPFEIIFPGTIELGNLYNSCECSHVEIAFLSSQEWAEWEKTHPPAGKKKEAAKGAAGPKISWIPLKVNSLKGIKGTEGARGIVRVSWQPRKNERLRLRVELWTQPEGNIRQRQFIYLQTLILVVNPVMFTQNKVNLGTLATGSQARQEVECWSATRPALNLEVANDDPLFDWKITPLNQKECQLLEERLKKEEINTRVQAACRIALTVSEAKQGKQLEQGPYQRKAPLSLDGQSYQALAPFFHGRVQGDVEVGGLDDLGKIQLQSFKAREGTKHRLVLWTEAHVTLTLESRKPPFLNVKLAVDQKGSSVKKKKWLMEVAVPPNCPAESFAEDSAILLRTHPQPSRLIRIPVLGTAVPG